MQGKTAEEEGWYIVKNFRDLSMVSSQSVRAIDDVRDSQMPLCDLSVNDHGATRV